jgi:phage I-like protein
MSSPKTAATKISSKTASKTTHKTAARAKPPTAKPAVKPAPEAADAASAAEAAAGTASALATQLAADIERGLADGRLDTLSPEALQALMAAACKAYAAQIEAGNPIAALAQRTTVTPTEVMVTASGLLRATNLAVFELGMWQSWTGR